MNLTDYIVLIWTLATLWTGWRQGFLKALVNLLLLVASAIAGFIYYSRTHNLLYSLAIVALVPFAGRIVFSIVLWVWNRGVNPKGEISLVSHSLGAGTNLLQGSFFLFAFLYLLSMLPPQIPYSQKISTDIRESLAYAFLQDILPDDFPSGEQIQKSFMALQDPKKIEASPAYQELAADPKVQDILADEKLIAEMKKGNFFKFMNNPKFVGILNDPELLKKFMNFQRDMMTQRPEAPASAPKQKPPVAESESAPKVYEMKRK